MFKATAALLVLLYSASSIATAPDIVEILRMFQATVKPVGEQKVFTFAYRNRMNRVHAHYHYMQFLNSFKEEVSYTKQFPAKYPNAPELQRVVQRALFQEEGPSQFCQAVKGLEEVWRSKMGQEECAKTVHRILDMAYQNDNTAYIFEAFGKDDEDQVFKEVGLLIYSIIDGTVTANFKMKIY